MRNEFLGHNEDGSNKFYNEDIDENYLVPLVNLIGAEYFGGDAINPK